MNLRIYEMEHSPFCIPITRALEALGQDVERIPVSNWDRRPVIELTGGRYYQVPVLVHGDDVIAESSPSSQDIARYVDTNFGGGRLFPESNAGLQEIVIEHIENDIEDRTFKLVDPLYLKSIEDAGARMMVIRHKERKFGAGCVDAWGRDR
ncbi:MAG: glutathione S-transferase N-terminal domain-containing protein, partial [Verrucomicrobiota bacterium]